MSDFQTALRVASIAHSGQRYGENDYFSFHVLDVVVRSQEVSDDPVIHTIAALHDIVEDTSFTIDNVAYFGLRVQHAVDALTRRENESRLDYLDRVKQNADAVIVKACDLKSNIAHDPGSLRARRYLSDLDYIEPTPCDLVRGPDGEFVDARGSMS